MKEVTKILLFCIVILSIASCSARKQPGQKHHAKYSNADISKLSKQYGIRLTQADNITLYDACSHWFGVRHRMGGNTKKGVDCSGLVSIIYKQVYGISTERNSAAILSKNCTPINRNNLREGDLVFFKTLGTGNPKTPTHIGIYLKNGKFIHASTSKGVIVSSMSEPYYIRTWITGGRCAKRK